MTETETPKKAAKKTATPQATEIAASNPVENYGFTMEDIKAYLLGVWTTLSDSQFNLFYNIAKYSNLNPYKREIYAVAYNSYNKITKLREPQLSIVTGYQVYIARAEKTGKLKGWEITTEDGTDGKIKSATIIINRAWFDTPFKWTVLYAEEVKTDKEGAPKSWRATRPVFMLKKVAIGQGFRLAFPNELEGMPYTEEEVGENNYIEPKEVNTVTPSISSEQALDWFTDGGEKTELAKNVEVETAATIDDVASEVASVWSPEIIEPEQQAKPEFVPPTADLIPEATATKAIASGARINHKLLGGGVVEDVDGDFAVVRFDRIPTEAKKIKASILTLA